MIHTLYREQVIPAPLERVWEYFCDPKNLNRITPPDMNFEIVGGGNVRMFEGQLIEYRVEFIRGVRSRWLTEISHVRECEYFVDLVQSTNTFPARFKPASASVLA